MESILSKSQAAAEATPASKTSATDWVFGPIPVGNIGVVGVVEVTFGQGDNARSYLYARMEGAGRPKSMPVAACAVLTDALRAAEGDSTPDEQDEQVKEAPPEE